MLYFCQSTGPGSFMGKIPRAFPPQKHCRCSNMYLSIVELIDCIWSVLVIDDEKKWRTNRQTRGWHSQLSGVVCRMQSWLNDDFSSKARDLPTQLDRLRGKTSSEAVTCKSIISVLLFYELSVALLLKSQVLFLFSLVSAIPLSNFQRALVAPLLS